MHTKKKRSRAPLIISLVLIVLLIGSAVGAYFIMKPKTTPAADISPLLGAYTARSRNSVSNDVISTAAAAELRCSLSGEAEVKYRDAVQNVSITQLDIERLTADMSGEMQEKLNSYVENAFDFSDVYDYDGNYLPKVLDNAYSSVLMSRLKHSRDYIRTDTVTLTLKYSDGAWHITDDTELIARLAIAFDEKPGYAAACSALQYAPFLYTLDDWTSAGPVPDPLCYGETDDVEVIKALINNTTAYNLTRGQQTAWNEDISILPGSTVKFYLDQTILAITWQQETQGGVGTFSEVFIGDASQLRRKIAGDIFACYQFYKPTELAAEANAVVAISGDYYDVPDTVHGTFAYNGKARWVNLHEGQTCFFTDKGDMLFAFEDQFTSEVAVQRFMDDNGVMFSASYGPVLVKDGVDITPENYVLGDINATYARCAIGQLGQLHYLMMTLNAVEPEYNVYFTARQAAQAMLEKGCTQAYALAGGHNATIVMDNKVMNPVQYGYEKYMCDIIYFATALK